MIFSLSGARHFAGVSTGDESLLRFVTPSPPLHSACAGTFAFVPSLLSRRFGTPLGIAGSALSGVMVFGALATLAGGAMCDAAFRRTGRAAVYALLPAAIVAATLPFNCWLCVGPSFGATVALFLPQTAAANIPSGPVRCLVSSLVPPHSRATANSVLEVRANPHFLHAPRAHLHTARSLEEPLFV